MVADKEEEEEWWCLEEQSLRIFLAPEGWFVPALALAQGWLRAAVPLCGGASCSGMIKVESYRKNSAWYVWRIQYLLLIFRLLSLECRINFSRSTGKLTITLKIISVLKAFSSRKSISLSHGPVSFSVLMTCILGSHKIYYLQKINETFA